MTPRAAPHGASLFCRRRPQFPLTAYLVTGTQADDAAANRLVLLKLTDLHRTKADGGDDSSSEDDDSDGDLDDDPTMELRMLKHRGCVNRVRSCPQHPHLVSTWSDTGRVHVYDVSAELGELERSSGSAGGASAAGGAAGAAGGGSSSSSETGPTFTFKGHTAEGYAMDWSPVTAGRLATGDCNNMIHVWDPTEAGHWAVDGRSPCVGHTSSVEDLQWSPTEDTVFASCSSDRTVRAPSAPPVCPRLLHCWT